MIQFDNLNINITKIIPVDWLEGTPARVYRPTGIVFINQKVWDTFSLPEKKFILLHEAGHYELQTISEKEADTYALYKYKGTEPLSLKNSINVLAKNLTPGNASHDARVKNLINEALFVDFTEYGNINALNKLIEMNNIEDKIKEIQVNYILSRGIKNVSGLSEAERMKLADEVMNCPEMIQFLASIQSNFSDSWFSNTISSIGKGISNVVKGTIKVVAPVAGAVLTGLGLPIIGNAVTALVNKTSGAVEAALPNPPAQPSAPPPVFAPAPIVTPPPVYVPAPIVMPPTPDPKDDKILGIPKTIFFVICGVLVIGAFLYFNNKK